MAPGAATLIVHLGQALAEWAGTAAAVVSGAISVAHAKVIVGFFAHLPDGVPPEALPECESYLLQAAATENPVESTRRAAALRHLLEPAEHSLPDAENTDLNELFAATTLGGRGTVKADLDAETVEMLHTALSGLSQPNPPPTAPATPARRRYDGRRRSPNCCAATSTVVTAPPKATNAPTVATHPPRRPAAAGEDNENDTTADQAPTADTAPRPAADLDRTDLRGQRPTHRV